ncbi:MAG: prepilin-type N-terminal cleavage/methylation domain-containing protein [Gammaproteobacteria bacterium]|nr:prepilin-type N-terminal cleavage/methylation domain-containing protein [Gammaproteobacteria bacterium]
MGGRREARGLSLIELMIALVIGTILMLGVMQVFGASRAAYQLAEGMGRSQENARFAIDFLQRDIRMAGHFGCVNDQAHARNSPPGMTTTFAAPAHPGLDFGVSIQGYEADGTAPGASITLTESPSAGGTAYTPGLPAEIDAATANRIAGSDILVLRYLAPEGVPITNIGGSIAAPVFEFEAGRWDVLRSGVTDPGLFGVADCLHTVVFQAAAVDPAAGSVTAGAAPNNAVADFSTAFTAGQSLLYRAESVVYYVGLNGSGRPSLYRTRFSAGPAGALTTDVQELVEGVENLQLLYGQDRVVDPALEPTGFIDRQVVASSVPTGTFSLADSWRRVGAVQIGLVVVSPDRAGAPTAALGDELNAAGVSYTAPADGRYRASYQTTIALRNRLYGN